MTDLSDTEQLNKDTDSISQSEKEPLTKKEIILLVFFGVLGCCLCYLTWAHPDLLNSVFDADTSGRGARKVKTFLGLLYNRVAGTLTGFIGIFFLYGVIASLFTTKKSGQ